MPAGRKRNNPPISPSAEMDIVLAIKDGCSYAEMRHMFHISDRDIMKIKIKYNLLTQDSPHWRPNVFH